eukprot:gene11061-biopygen12374
MLVPLQFHNAFASGSGVQESRDRAGDRRTIVMTSSRCQFSFPGCFHGQLLQNTVLKGGGDIEPLGNVAPHGPLDVPLCLCPQAAGCQNSVTELVTDCRRSWGSSLERAAPNGNWCFLRERKGRQPLQNTVLEGDGETVQMGEVASLGTMAVPRWFSIQMRPSGNGCFPPPVQGERWVEEWRCALADRIEATATATEVLNGGWW